MVFEVIQLGIRRSWASSVLHLGLLSCLCSWPDKPAGTKTAKVSFLRPNSNSRSIEKSSNIFLMHLKSCINFCTELNINPQVPGHIPWAVAALGHDEPPLWQLLTFQPLPHYIPCLLIGGVDHVLVFILLHKV
jgi:hypothetical protein